MSARVYEKLVRDRIPELIAASGQRPVTRTLAREEYRRALEAKLTEEVREYLEAGSLEELADVLTVVEALCIAQGDSLEALARLRDNKLAARGGFEARVYLERVETEEE